MGFVEQRSYALLLLLETETSILNVCRSCIHATAADQVNGGV